MTVGHRFACAAAFAALSCVTTNRILVHEAAVGDKTTHEVGLEYDLTHIPTTGFTGQKAGYHAVHGSDDWLLLWEEARPDHAKNPPAPAVDWRANMAIAVAAAEPEVLTLEITAAVKVDRTIHVYVSEDVAGKSCKPSARKAPLMDIVTIPNTDLDLEFHVDREPSDSCGPGPEVAITCKLAGQGTGADKLTAAPGQVIECDGTKVTASSGIVADRNWFLTTRPPGSFAQLAVDPKEEHAKLTLDAFGSYSVKMEAVDDQEKHGEASVAIEVPPPYDGQFVQLGWTKYDPKDDPTTFPRYELKVVEVGTANTCTEQAPKAPWCDVKASAYVKFIHLHPAPKARYKLEVKYVDDRFKGAAVLCFRTFMPGASGAPPKTVDTCDDMIRKAGTTWVPGALDPDTGGFEDPTKPHVPPPPPPPPPAASGSAAPPAAAPPPAGSAPH